MWVYRILILIVYYTHEQAHTREVRRPRGSAGALSGEDQSDAGALSGEDQREVVGPGLLHSVLNGDDPYKQATSAQ